MANNSGGARPDLGELINRQTLAPQDHLSGGLNQQASQGAQGDANALVSAFKLAISPLTMALGALLSPIASLTAAILTNTSATTTRLIGGGDKKSGVLYEIQAKAKDFDKAYQEIIRSMRAAVAAGYKGDATDARAAALAATASAPAASPSSGAGAALSGGLMSAVKVVAGFAAATVAATVAIVKLVEVFNPSIVELFNRSLANVAATIGGALSPIILQFTQALIAINNMIAPMFGALQPILSAFADHLVSIVMPALGVLLDLAQAIMPLLSVIAVMQSTLDNFTQMFLGQLSAVISMVAVNLKLLALVLSPFTALMSIFSKALLMVSKITETLTKIIVAVVDGFMNLIGDLLEPLISWLPSLDDVLKGLTTATASATRAIVIFAARIMSYFGFSSGVAALLKQFDKTGTGKIAAPKDLAFSTLEDIMKKQLLAAAGAIGQVKDSPELEQQRLMVKELKEINARMKAKESKGENSSDEKDPQSRMRMGFWESLTWGVLG